MQNIMTMVRREMGGYFLSPIAYVVLAIFLFTTGLAFGLGVFESGNEASLRNLLFPWTVVVLAFVLPMLTMRLLAEEFRSGTIETLMTAPISDSQIVLGKFLGAVAFYIVLILAMLLYPILIVTLGGTGIDGLLLLCNLLGLLLLGSLFIAVGLFFSACTRHQIIAGLLSIPVLGLMTFAFTWLGQLVEVSFLRNALLQLSVGSHFQELVKGILSLNSVAFFVSMTALFLFLAVKRLEVRRWQ